MTNFCNNNYCCLVMLLIYVTNSCCKKNFIIDDLELGSSGSVEDSGSNDDAPESDLQIYQGVCKVPIDAGDDCKIESRAIHENGLSGITVQERKAIHEVYDVKEFYEVNKQFGLKKRNLQDLFKYHTHSFGYNKNTGKCEEFIYSGCKGNSNRFESLKKCRKTCYTPLKYFLAEVTDLLRLKVANSPEEITT